MAHIPWGAKPIISLDLHYIMIQFLIMISRRQDLPRIYTDPIHLYQDSVYISLGIKGLHVSVRILKFVSIHLMYTDSLHNLLLHG